MQLAVPRCRLCKEVLHHTLIDLGCTPLANALLTPAQAAQNEDRAWPLHVRICAACTLVQADAAVPPAALFQEYPYHSSVSTSWVAHAERFAATMIARLGLGRGSTVLEIASNDGYLLQHFRAHHVRVLGIEPAANVAVAARARGIPTRIGFFDDAYAHDLSARGVLADLVVANNVLAHVPDLAGFVAGISRVLAPGGLASFEFPHLLRLLEGVQFDTIYHEHYSYLSLRVVELVLAQAGLRACDAQALPTHGGSLRVVACHAASEWTEQPGLAAIRAEEDAARLDAADTYEGFSARVAAVQQGVRDFLAEAASNGRRVAAYGAAAKGCTLLNTSGVTAADIICVADRCTAKQGRMLPGCRVPVVSPDMLRRAPPDDVLILPWNLADEISEELHDLRASGTRLWTAVPELREVAISRAQ